MSVSSMMTATATPSTSEAMMSNDVLENATGGTVTGDGQSVTEGSNTPLNSSSYSVIAVYMVICCVLGLIGNLGLIAAMFHKGVWRRPAVNVYVLAIVCASLVEALAGYPVLISSNFYGRWLFGDLGCTYYAFTVYCCVIVQMTCYLMVTIHRYRVVVQQLPPDSTETRHWVAWSVGGTVIYALVWGACPLLGWGGFAQEPFGTSCSLDWTTHRTSAKMYNLMVCIFQLFLPVVTMVILSVKVMKKVNLTVAAGIVNGPATNGTTNTTALSESLQSRSLKIVVMTLAVFLTCWSPYGIMCMLSNFDVPISAGSSVLPTMMTKAFPAINPIIYFACYHHYRISFKELFGQTD